MGEFYSPISFGALEFNKFQAPSSKAPNHNTQIPNKSQHAAQAPALRVTKIQNHKRLVI
jgi:hypothetical protein